MNKRITLAIILLMLAAAHAFCATPRHPDELTLETIEFKPLKTESKKLDCGIPVYIFENHDLPLVRVEIHFRMGTRYLPVEDFAAIRLLGGVWCDGGTRELSPEALDGVLASKNISIDGYVGGTSGFLSTRCVREDLEDALAYWRDVLLEPRFDPLRLERAKGKRQKTLEQINNHPAQLVDWHFGWKIGGSDRPESYPESRVSIEAVTEQDLRELHARFIHPSNAIIGVSGDIKPRQLMNLLDDLLEDWTGSPEFELPVKQERRPRPEPGVYVLAGDYAQSHVRMGRLVMNLNKLSPEYAAARLQNYALGYGRVFFRTRQEGLSYGCGILMSFGQERSTLKTLGSCRPEVTLKILETVREEVRRVETEPLTNDEIDAARAFFIGQAIKQNEQAGSLVHQKLDDLINDRPEDHFERYFEALIAADSLSVNRCTHEFAHMNDSLVVVVVGNPEGFEASLENLGLGPVKELEPYPFGQ